MLIRLPKIKWVRDPEMKEPFAFDISKRDGTEDLYVNANCIVSIRPAYEGMSGRSLENADYCMVQIASGKYYQEYQILGSVGEIANLCGHKSTGQPAYATPEYEPKFGGQFKVVPS